MSSAQLSSAQNQNQAILSVALGSKFIFFIVVSNVSSDNLTYGDN